MDDGARKQTPRITPPPRITAAGGSDPAGAPGKRHTPVKPGRRIALFAAMAFGLIMVFVILPRWQERRQIRPTSREDVLAAAPSASVPNPTAPDTSATVGGARKNPSPRATPSSVPVIIAAPPRTTPRPQPSLEKRQYVEAMSEGLAALDKRRWQAALDAFARASKLRPGTPEVADGFARANAGQRLDTVAGSIQTAQDFEQDEDWRKAERAYSSVLALDPESAAALDGHKRTDVRATLDETIEYHLANPGRLTTPEVFSDATSALEDALETVPSGPRLERQIVRLEALLKQVSTPVAVVLESDDLTEVMVYRVGRLGTFSRRELDLKPGAYTVVGSRHGYRDVRLQLVVTPGSRPKPFVVQCTESL